MGRDVIIACDFAGAGDCMAFLDKFTGKKPFVKIGMELFYAEGTADSTRDKGEGTQDIPRLKAARHTEHGKEVDGGSVAS